MKFSSILLLGLAVAFFLSMQPAFATTVTWSAHHVDPTTGWLLTGNFTVTVNDPSLAGNSVADTINVQINSTSDPTGITLTIPETGDTGSFTNHDLIFNNSTGTVQIESTQTVGFSDSLLAGSGFIQSDNFTTGINVYSFSDNAANPFGIPLNLTETGSGTGVFKTDLLITNGPSVNYHAIHVVPGDVVTLYRNDNTGTINQLVLTNPDSATGVLTAKFGDTISAIYGGVRDDAVLDSTTAPGGGGGGLIRPSLVLDVVGGVGGLAGVDRQPPSFALNVFSAKSLNLPDDIKKEITNHDPYKPISPIVNSSIQFPIVINQNGYPISGYANTIVTDNEQTGKPVLLKLHFTDESGVQHVEFYTNMHHQGDEIRDSDTYILYDKNAPLVIHDPNGFFSNATVISKVDGYTTNLLYNITFAKPMSKSDIILRAWDTRRNSFDTKIFDAWQIVKNNNTNENATKSSSASQLVVQQTNSSVISQITPNNSSQVSVNENKTMDTMTAIKMWSGYSPTSISDAELLKQVGINGTYIPPWFLKTGKFLIDGEMTQQEFVNILKYMADNHIIK